MSTTAKGAPYPQPGDPNDVAGALAALAAWADARAGISTHTTAQRDVLVGADIWAGRVIFNVTTQQLEINRAGAPGAAAWSPVDAPARSYGGYAEIIYGAATQTQAKTITLPAGIFTAPPSVVISPGDHRFTVGVSGITTTQFVVTSYYLLGTANASFTLPIQWIAKQG